MPVCIFGYQAATGHWPDFQNQDDLAKLGAEAFAFVNVARFAVPLRIGLALSTTPWVQVCHPPTRAPRLVLQARARRRSHLIETGVCGAGEPRRQVPERQVRLVRCASRPASSAGRG